MSQPYDLPSDAIAPVITQPGIRWFRIAAWSCLIFASANLVGIISGLSMVRWDIYGDTIQEAVATARLVRRLGYGVVGALGFWCFTAGLSSRRAANVLALFALIQAIDLCVSLLLGATIQDWLDPWSLGRSALAAALGVALAGWRSSTAQLAPAT